MFTGCKVNLSVDNTPKKQVENYLYNYQSISNEVIQDLELTVEKQNNFTESQKEKYKEIMKNNFKNLSYTVKDEVVNGDKSTVEVEIIVSDFYSVMNKNNIDDMLDSMENTKEKVKYTLYFNVEKDENNKWKVHDLDEIEEEKILGVYPH